MGRAARRNRLARERASRKQRLRNRRVGATLLLLSALVVLVWIGRGM